MRDSGGASGLVRYLAAATLVRTADSGATVGLVLLALDPQLRIAHAATIGGLLAAALSAPHLLGPWLANRLDRARDGRGMLAAAYLSYAIALAGGASAVGHLPLAVPMVAVALAGCCGPLLTGGLSSRLASIAGPSEHSQRRAQGWDALTYGVGGTAGPAVVAGLAVLSGPLAALLGLSAGAVLGAGLTLTLPVDRTRRPARFANGVPAPGIRAGIAVLITSGPLRRVTTLTLLNAVQLGALPVIAVTLGRLMDRPGGGAILTVAVGLGNLAGAALVTAVPLRGEPERLAVRLFAVAPGVAGVCALAPSFGLFLVGFALIGVFYAMAFTSTLAARSKYAPESARAQVFVTSAGLKIAVASVGSAAAGLGAGLGGRVLLLGTGVITAMAVLAAVVDRLIESRRGPSGREDAGPEDSGPEDSGPEA